MAQTSHLKVASLSKSYGSSTVLKNVSFEINGHEALGYIGTNGSGKSTTVKILLGLTDATSGTVLFNGTDIRSDMTDWRRRIGYVPELPTVYGYLSPLEFLELVGRLRAMPEPRLQEKSQELVRLLALWDFRQMPMASYSKGMKQRVLIAAALIHNPAVLILDEPLSGLDSQSAVILRRVIIALRNSGKCILYSSHTLESVETICTRVAVLHQGEVIGYGAVGEVREQMAKLKSEAGQERDSDEEIERVSQQLISVISD